MLSFLSECGEELCRFFKTCLRSGVLPLAGGWAPNRPNSENQCRCAEDFRRVVAGYNQIGGVQIEVGHSLQTSAESAAPLGEFPKSHYVHRRLSEEHAPDFSHLISRRTRLLSSMNASLNQSRSVRSLLGSRCQHFLVGGPRSPRCSNDLVRPRPDLRPGHRPDLPRN